jgi:homoserine dehydrogenase
MTTVVPAEAPVLPDTDAPPATHVRLALLGLGRIGCAVTRLARGRAAAGFTFTIASALVRDVHRARPIQGGPVPLTTDPTAALECRPDVVVEALGGLEPARTLVLAALSRGIPVVTANKSLLAIHGDELFAAAAQTGTPLLYEASVIAGVPFLGTFGNRPLARSITSITGIVNGTGNYILSRMASDRVSVDVALADAQRAGYAEPDPSKDVRGGDAAEKLCVLLRHFGGWAVAPADVETLGITDIRPCDLEHAAAFGGVLRPVVIASWDNQGLAAHAGPAFLRSTHPLANVDGVQNGIVLGSDWCGELFFSGPGAGPTVTAATVLDDVVEACRQRGPRIETTGRRAVECRSPETGWFIRLTAEDLVDAQQAPGFLASLGIRVLRSSRPTARDGRQYQWLLTAPCTRAHLRAALDVLAARSGAGAWSLRVVE